MATLFLDTETTGLSRFGGADLVEVALVDEDGDLWFETLVNPGHPIPHEAWEIHGITDDMVRDAPSADFVRRQVLDIARGHTVIAYNARFDCQFFPGLLDVAARVLCCMESWTVWCERDRWSSLVNAAGAAGFRWPSSGPHRALADALACRHVWRYMDAEEERAARWIGARNAELARRRARFEDVLRAWPPLSDGPEPLAPEQTVEPPPDSKGKRYSWWDQVPPGLHTRTTLSNHGLMLPKGTPSWARISYEYRGHPRTYDLFRAVDARPKRRAAPTAGIPFLVKGYTDLEGWWPTEMPSWHALAAVGEDGFSHYRRGTPVYPLRPKRLNAIHAS